MCAEIFLQPGEPHKWSVEMIGTDLGSGSIPQVSHYHCNHLLAVNQETRFQAG